MENNKTILVTGGAGYIGSHVALALIDAGYRVVILDNLSTGLLANIPNDSIFVEGDIENGALVRDICKRYSIVAVMHLAAYIKVDESVREPEKYLRNNTENTRILSDNLVEAGVNKIIFSSTAAVYGNADRMPIDENADIAHINPYGESKARAEEILLDSPSRVVILRYFNVAGVDALCRAGYNRDGENNHLVRAALRAAQNGTIFQIFGDDYQTNDGTCIRDFVHVSDIAYAHILALKFLENGGKSSIYNCGSAHGYSVREVINAAQKLTGNKCDISIMPRRQGDVAVSVARVDKIQKDMGWCYLRDLDTIISDEMRWINKK